MQLTLNKHTDLNNIGKEIYSVVLLSESTVEDSMIDMIKQLTQQGKILGHQTLSTDLPFFCYMLGMSKTTEYTRKVAEDEENNSTQIH